MLRTLDILLDDGFPSHCYYHHAHGMRNTHALSIEDLRYALDFSRANDVSLRVMYGNANPEQQVRKLLDCVAHESVVRLNVEACEAPRKTVVFTVNASDEPIVLPAHSIKRAILRCAAENFSKLPAATERFLSEGIRVDIRVLDLGSLKSWQVESYRAATREIGDVVLRLFREGKAPRVSSLTDYFLEENHGCGAGSERVSLAPDGKLYICPGFYANPSLGIGSVGTLRSGICIPDGHLLEQRYSPICRMCETGHCPRCPYLNRLYTEEMNIPSEQQCVVSHVERDISFRLYETLREENIVGTITGLSPVDVYDPIEYLLNQNKRDKSRRNAIAPESHDAGSNEASFPYSGNELSSMLTREKLDFLYGEYLGNLHRLPYGMRWLDPRVIRTNGENEWQISMDIAPELRASPNVESEPQKIDMRSYWPLFVVGDERGFRARGDDYRVDAYQTLMQERKWSGEILTITDIPITSDEKVRYTIPSPSLVSCDFKQKWFHAYASPPIGDKYATDSDVVPYETDDGYYVATLWSEALQVFFFEYGAKTGEVIEPSPVINDFSAWNEWRGF